MNDREASAICGARVLPVAIERFGLIGWETNLVDAHEGGRNIVYACSHMGDERFLRLSHLSDRAPAQYVAEIEYVHYLAEHGARVARPYPSLRGRWVEEILVDGHVFFACLFDKAKGDSIAAHGYRYIAGRPLTEYFFNTGVTLGKIHALSKTYAPIHARYDFFDKYNMDYIDGLIPDDRPLLKRKIAQLLDKLRALERNPNEYGMVHFDFSDGNYSVDYETGDVTAYDFDNACTFFYLYDLANLWVHGEGWIFGERGMDKRRAAMDAYFAEILRGYRSQTSISERAPENLPLFIQAVMMEGVVDAYEVARNQGEEAEDDDEHLLRAIKCLERDIPYAGLFSRDD